jgi:predicted nucleic acid-binding protein
MADVVLDSSVVIGLVFRHAGERTACRTALPLDGKIFCSRYVIFEVARGFLRSLIALHNYSLEFRSFADLHLAAYSGQQRFKPYRMHTWLGAFTDYQAALEAEDGPCDEGQKVEELRAKLRIWIRRGWRRMEVDFSLMNAIGCREDLPPPALRGDQRIDQRLPDGECGQPAACQLQAFIQTRKPYVEAVAAGLEALPASQKDKETVDRIDGLQHLLAVAPGAPFEGKKCYRCGDALICLEAPRGHIIATKNRKHFEPLARILGNPLAVAETARSTT